jgi:predicted SAM-dependent methyltransferase
MSLVENKAGQKLYVQYGAGNQAVSEWISFDASPTLLLQRIWLIGAILTPKLNAVFDNEILYGCIVRGLPLKIGSVDGIFCSHVLEHLAYDDFRVALKNTFKYLKKGGRFRLIVPNLEYYINRYLINKETSNFEAQSNAASNFMEGTSLGNINSRLGIFNRLRESIGNSRHQWMWDFPGLKMELESCGFINIQKFQAGNCNETIFLNPEREHQFGDVMMQQGLAIECFKP